MNEHFGSGVLRPVVALGKRADDLNGSQRSGTRVVLQERDRRCEFVDHVSPTPVPMERHVARSGPGRHLHLRVAAPLQSGRLGVKRVRDQLVRAEIRHDHLPPVGREVRRVRVWLTLALRMDAGAAVLEVGHQFADPSVRLDRQGHGVAVPVVDRRQSGGRRVHGNVGRAATGSSASIEFSQSPGRPIDREGRSDAFRRAPGPAFAADGV